MADAATGRLRPALTLALAGSASLFVVLLVHEILAFGTQPNDLIAPSGAPCAEPPCLTTGMVVTGLLAKSLGAGIVFAIIGALWTTGPARWLIAAGFFALQYLWSLVGIASGYRGYFGTNWAWWEPFAELLWHPVTTPALLLAGMAGCLGLDRLVRPWRLARAG
ncbi:hypothetical protein HKCCSP123_12115 [Rhodobacterales bacterium HKCCSP123]|nr:hypothetical protein [Rhodobacterales bacterium HKCCSP123]